MQLRFILPALLLIVLGAVSWSRYGSATRMPPSSFVPGTSLKDVIFWSTIAFAFSGVESASTMGEEIQDARRTVPRAFAYGMREKPRKLARICCAVRCWRAC